MSDNFDTSEIPDTAWEMTREEWLAVLKWLADGVGYWSFQVPVHPINIEGEEYRDKFIKAITFGRRMCEELGLPDDDISKTTFDSLVQEYITDLEPEPDDDIPEPAEEVEVENAGDANGVSEKKKRYIPLSLTKKDTEQFLEENKELMDLLHDK